jgi:hypothetical protein
MNPSKIWLAAVCVTLVCVPLIGCGETPPKSPEMSDVFGRLPVPPQAQFVSRSGGADALQITVRTPMRPDVIATYYRTVLKSDGWKLINDAKDRGGAVVLFAQRENRPLWVRVRLDPGSGGSLVDLAGAVVAGDSVKPATAPGAKPTS